jgi:hypothetical protein
MKTVYKWWAALVFVAVIVQIGLAGYGAFETAHKLQDSGSVLDHNKFDDFWSPHGAFGTLLVLGMIVLLVLGLAARLGRPAIWWPLALAVAGVVQIFLAGLGTSVPGIGFLHPVNALLIFTLSGLIVHRTWNAKA